MRALPFFALTTLTALTALAACSKPAPKEKFSLSFLNPTKRVAGLMVDGVRAAAAQPGKSTWTFVTPNKTHKLEVIVDGKVVETAELTPDPAKDGADAHYYIQAGQGSYAFVNVRGFYKGGNFVVNATKDDEFKIVERHSKKKQFVFAKHGLVALPGDERLPSSTNVFTDLYYLCPVAESWTDDEAILKGCLARLAAAN